MVGVWKKKKVEPKADTKELATKKPQPPKKLSLLELLEAEQPSLNTRRDTALKADTPDAYELKRAARCLQETIYWLKQLKRK